MFFCSSGGGGGGALCAWTSTPEATQYGVRMLHRGNVRQIVHQTCLADVVFVDTLLWWTRGAARCLGYRPACPRLNYDSTARRACGRTEPSTVSNNAHTLELTYILGRSLPTRLFLIPQVPSSGTL